MEKKENIIFLGNSGTGKSHLVTGIGVEMIKNGYKVKFISDAELGRSWCQAPPRKLPV